MTDTNQETATPNPGELLEALSKFKDAPDGVKLEEWKQLHGEVFCSAFSDDEVFIWRTLNRKEYVTIQKTPREQPLSEFEFQELIVNSCLLWASNKQSLVTKGGSVTTIAEQIMLNSNFVAPAVAASLVLRL